MTATDSTYAALHRAVCAAPDDDAPRLILADWLDEHGEPERAEFIRLQIELANRDDERDRCCLCVRRSEQHHNGPCRSQLKEKIRREYQLLNQPSRQDHGVANWYAWSNGVIDLLPISSSGQYKSQPIVYRRGFVDSVYCGIYWWVVRGSDIIKNAPIVASGINITDVSPVRISGLVVPKTADSWCWGIRGEHDDDLTEDMMLPRQIARLLPSNRLLSEQSAIAAMQAACWRWAQDGLKAAKMR